MFVPEDHDIDPYALYQVRLPRKALQFAQWVFSPQGIRSLDVVAFGDFAYGGHMEWNNHILVRDATAKHHWRHLRPQGREWEEVVDRHGSALRFCPNEP